MMDGVIFRSGGSVLDDESSNAVKSTVKLDLNPTNPAWVQMDDMERERKNHTLVALPDGRILAMGGNLNSAATLSGDRATSEALDTESTSPTWVLQATPPNGEVIGRGYHSTALLLPDARVIFAGGEREGNISWSDQRKPQFFTPHYGGNPNWADSRPAITAGPTAYTIRYGETFEVDVSVAQTGGRTLSKFRLISLGATTHAFNENQQYVTLAFTPHASVANRYVVNAPASTFKATPGFYMLFAVDSLRYPSVAKIIQLKDFERRFPTTIAAGSGSYPLTTPLIKQSLLGDNQYVGGWIYSFPGDPSVASINASAQFAGGAYTKSRITIECRTTESTDYQIQLKNYSTGLYETVKSGTVGNTDTKIEHVVAPGGLTPYISSTGVVEANFVFEQPNQALFNLFVDKIEFGVR